MRFLAHLSTTCSRGAVRVVRCPSSVVLRASSTISLNIFSCQTTGPIWTKLGRNVPWEVLFKNFFTEFDSIKNSGCHGNEIEFLSNSLKIFSSESIGPILKYFHRNVPYVTLFKDCSRNFDRPQNMALVNGGVLRYRDMKKFLKSLLLRNC